MTKKFVLGFMIMEDDYDRVVLIRKNRPEALAGLLNGVGGKIEESDTHEGSIFAPQVHAMVREYQEETGVETGLNEWMPIDVIDWVSEDVLAGTIYVFVAVGDVYKAKTMESEEIDQYEIKEVVKRDDLSDLALEQIVNALMYIRRNN